MAGVREAHSLMTASSWREAGAPVCLCPRAGGGALPEEAVDSEDVTGCDLHDY
jgi:hypothetical protein